MGAGRLPYIFGSPLLGGLLEDGKFKAVPKTSFDELVDESQRQFKAPRTSEQARAEVIKYVTEYEKETFDISGTIDTENPIFTFYESDVWKFLRRIRPECKRVTDEQGVGWFEMRIGKRDARAPVKAFGV